MRSRLRRADPRTTVLALLCVVAVGFAVAIATDSPVPVLDFKQTGHWVYNRAVGAIFHIDGATKQVDAKVSIPDENLEAYLTVQGAKHGYAVGESDIAVFDKATLTVDTTLGAAVNEEPVGVEIAGGPYLVYRQAGTIVRLAVPPVVIQAGGPIADPVRTGDGTLWVRRVDSGALCGVAREAVGLRCPGTAPNGHAGALTVVGDRPAFIDATADALLVLDGDRLGEPTPLTIDLPDGAMFADSDADGRLALVDPVRGELLLIDVAGPGAHRAAAPPVRVDLGDGRFSAPVATDGAFAVLDEAAGTLLTFDTGGVRRAVVEVTEPGKRMAMLRGEDGRVYVDDGAGARTHVVDRGGSVTAVRTGGPDVPSAPPPPPSPPGPPSQPPGATQAAQSPPGAPSAVQARAGDAAVTVSWVAARSNGSPLRRYHLSWAVISGDGAGGATSVPGNRLTTTLTGLRNGTTYRVTVVAENAVGRGPGADSPPVTPSSEVPGSPTDVTAVANPDGSATVAWRAADGQGRSIRRYEVVGTGADGSTTQPAQATATTVRVSSGLALGTSYTFRVTAINDSDVAGPPSAPSGAVRPFTPAESPGGLAAAGGDRTVSLTWTAPALNGGQLVHYEVVGDGLPTQTVTGMTAQFSGLSNGTGYRFQVRAVTREQGRTGGPTAQGAVASVTGTPGTTPIVDVVSAVLSGDRQVTARVVVNDQGSGAVTCHLYFNGGQLWSGGCAGSQDITVGGLAYSTTYQVNATGSNAYGTGGVGGGATVRTNDPPPPPPPSVTVSKGAPVNRPECTDPSCAFVHVAVRNLGAPYRVECRNSTGVFWTYTTSSADSEVCFYGYRGTDVWVRVNGIESNHLPW